MESNLNLKEEENEETNLIKKQLENDKYFPSQQTELMSSF